jgi:hypothetical protein
MKLVIIKGGSWLFCAKIITILVLRVGSSFLLIPTLNTSPEPYLQKVLPCRHPCHTCDLGPVWSGKSQLPCSQRLRLHRLTSSDLGLRTWDPMWSGPKKQVFFQQYVSPRCSYHLNVYHLQKLDHEISSIFFLYIVNFGIKNVFCEKVPRVTQQLVGTCE